MNIYVETFGRIEIVISSDSFRFIQIYSRPKIYV